MDFLGRAPTINVVSSIEVDWADAIVTSSSNNNSPTPDEVINVTPPKGSENQKTQESMNTKSICSLHNLFQYKNKHPIVP